MSEGPVIMVERDYLDPNCPVTAACRQAVLRTYASLRGRGADERVAFEAAETVYSWHHPEVPRQRVPFVIADWLP